MPNFDFSFDEDGLQPFRFELEGGDEQPVVSTGCLDDFINRNLNEPNYKEVILTRTSDVLVNLFTVVGEDAEHMVYSSEDSSGKDDVNVIRVKIAILEAAGKLIDETVNKYYEELDELEEEGEDD